MSNFAVVDGDIRLTTSGGGQLLHTDDQNRLKVVMDMIYAPHTLSGTDHTGQLSNTQVTASNVTQHESFIDHDNLLNYDLTEHRILNDGIETDTNLWSAQKISSEITTATGSLTTDHGELTGLSDDDHTQYHNDTRGDARYYTQTQLNNGQLDNRYYTESEVDALTWLESDITDLDKYTQNEVDTISGSLSSEIDSDISTHTSNTDAHHAESHTVASHSDTTATGAELNTLTGGGDTTLHDHDGISENTAARHAESHTITSHSDIVDATGAQIEELTGGGDTTLHDHDGISENTVHRNSDGSDHTFINQNVTTVALPMFGSATLRNGTTSGTSYLEIGAGGTGNRYAYIDLVGDDTYTDYGFRILRNNQGENAILQMDHKGTGDFQIQTSQASAIKLLTSGANTRLTIGAAGGITLENGTSINEFSTDDTLAGDSDDAVPTEQAVKAYVDTVSGSLSGGNHTIASHSDTTATGAELDTLTDNSIADALHRHSELVASDGSPDPALSIDADGNVGIGTTSSGEKLEVNGNLMLSGNANVYIKNDIEDGSNFSWFNIKGAGTSSSMLLSLGTGATSVGGVAAVYGGVWSSTNTQIYHDGTDGWLTTSAGDLVFNPSGDIYLTDSKVLYTDEIRARDSAGLLLRDDSGTLGITIDDGGNVTINDSVFSSGSGQIGVIGTGNRSAFFSLYGDDTGYGIRLVRGSTGVNAYSQLAHNGTGDFRITAEDAAPILLQTNNTTRLTISSSGSVSLLNGTSINEFSTDTTLSGNSDDAVPTEKAVKTYVDTVSGTLSGGGGVSSTEDNVWSETQLYDDNSLTCESTTVWDMETYQNTYLLLTEDTTLSGIVPSSNSGYYTCLIENGDTYTLTLDNQFLTSEGEDLSFTTTSGAIDILGVYLNNGSLYASLSTNFS